MLVTFVYLWPKYVLETTQRKIYFVSQFHKVYSMDVCPPELGLAFTVVGESESFTSWWCRKRRETNTTI